ncbi:MAG: response regulator transcription factor [Bacteroidota bacterium]
MVDRHAAQSRVPVMTHVAADTSNRLQNQGLDRAVSPALRVLLVDDSPAVRRSIAERIRPLGHIEVVGEAENATTGYRFATDLKPDAVVLDINMPDRSGVWVLRMLKRDQLDAHVLVFTNHGSDFYRRKCLEAGALAFFDKHVEFDALVGTLENLADRKLGA